MEEKDVVDVVEIDKYLSSTFACLCNLSGRWREAFHGEKIQRGIKINSLCSFEVYQHGHNLKLRSVRCQKCELSITNPSASHFMRWIIPCRLFWFSQNVVVSLRNLLCDLCNDISILDFLSGISRSLLCCKIDNYRWVVLVKHFKIFHWRLDKCQIT